jgi:transcriptional regulator with XRE-family HTH domain
MLNDKDFTKKQLLKIGNRLRQLRKAKGYSNYELFAFDNKIARAQYGRYEKGEDLRVSSLIKVLCALDIYLSEFFDYTFI